MTWFLLTVLCLTLLCSLTDSLSYEVPKEHTVSYSLEDQTMQLSASLSSVQQKLADSLEAQNRIISASQSSLRAKLAEKSCISHSLEAHNRHLSAILSAVQQKLARSERQFGELHANHSELLKTLTFCQANRGCNECDSGWENHLGQCYLFSTQKLNWVQSRDYCISKGADLVIINCQQEQTFVSSRISVTHWIGLSDLGTEGQWHWVDDTPLSQTKKQFWYKRENGRHEPDNWTGGRDPNGEDCAALGNQSGFNQWFDASCTSQKRFVCEK